MQSAFLQFSFCLFILSFFSNFFPFWLCQLKSWIEQNRVWNSTQTFLFFGKLNHFAKSASNLKGVYCSINLEYWSLGCIGIVCVYVCTCTLMCLSLLLDSEFSRVVPVHSLVQLWCISQKKHISSSFRGQEGLMGTGREGQSDQI